MIAIIEYGLGNVKAFVNLYKRLNIPITVARTAADLMNATKIILPGVGAFDNAMERLEKSGMKEALDELVIHSKLPAMGICVGMQMLAHSSEEGRLSGLGWIDGEVRKLDVSALKDTTRLPHMGWNDVQLVRSSPLFDLLGHDARFYFLHSYYFQCLHSEDVLAVTEYGGTFACAVNSGNIYGVQFHPEKSHQYGIQLLKNFANL